jgi:hypothetical protein
MAHAAGAEVAGVAQDVKAGFQTPMPFKTRLV